MKRVFQLLLFVTIGFILLVSCEKDEPLPTMRLCDDKENFYYSGEEKIYLGKQSLSEIYIVFEQENVTKEFAESILSKYSFITNSAITGYINYDQVWLRINETLTDCTQVNNYLKELNKDDEIYSATPIFYTNENDPNSYVVLLSEVLTKIDEDNISESDFIDYAESKNLELISSRYSIQYFKNKKVETGFESLEISQQIYESGKAAYSHPNFIVKIELH
ncbi:hypothetical protein [Cyclobacterium amurskyense]|uniref:Lipoprotein n=1 Tax=Cyclobacterium amurskyense TaxID=320787 RepID=A0A0H4PX15_9BACT|nr:hypothetical protein [Cyclobacterium amurskyense]AKP52912.1 hypothetical protein CA2015_3532 [Cyclobacterium amurskyense]